MKGAKYYECQSDFIAKKYVRIISAFANKTVLSLDKALDLFYRSELYSLLREGVSDLHCMSDAYLADELLIECHEKYNFPCKAKDTSLGRQITFCFQMCYS